MDVSSTSIAAKPITKDHTIDRLIAFRRRYGRWPKQRELDDDSGLALGRWLNAVKRGLSPLNKGQRDRLLAVDPHALDVNHISHAAKTVTMDHKIDRLIAFYHQHGRWPKRREADDDTGFGLGRLLQRIKKVITSSTKEERIDYWLLILTLWMWSQTYH